MSLGTLGRYELQSVIGEGPHGTVYRATLEGQRPVALKVLAPEGVKERALEPFRKYVQGLARVRHPGIARFIELVEADGKVGLVFELVEGAPLATLLKDGAFPEPKKAWHIARQVLEALSHAHAQSIFHRNLKPENILLGADDTAVLTDCGISMLFASPGPRFEFLAPEHFGHGKISARSDLYQFGVVVYQMVTGKLPFTGTPAEIEQRVLKEKPADPSSHNNHLAWQFDWVIQKALAKAQEERYAGAFDFAHGLRLGMQDTVGRSLEPAKAPAAAASAVVQNARVLAERPAAAPQPAQDELEDLIPPDLIPAAAAKPAPPKPEAAPTASPAAAAAPAPAPAARSGKPGVLLVDDDPRILNSLRALLRQDYEIQTAEDGEAALQVLQGGGIQVIVSDQRMPRMTGVELLRKARTLAPDATRILLTGYTDLASLVGSINQGEVFRFVMKPWDNDDLRKALVDAAQAAAAAAGTRPAKPLAPRSAGSLLVVDTAESMARGLERLLAGEARVIRVATPAEAAKVLSREEVAAIVADMGAGMDGLVALFRELKAKRPGVLSILLTDEPDSELAIELINRAHIFRFMPKPVSARELRTQVADALRRYSVFKQSGGRAAATAPPAAPAAARA